ncbi:MAG: hypothetical protein O3A46_07080, partial [Candidatus Poribacteria bacterium]|nr:hypothetical protein [Candidatus Poribacteria bacterium]
MIPHLTIARLLGTTLDDAGAPYVLTGIAAADGLAMGPLVVYSTEELRVADRRILPSDTEREWERLTTAVEHTRRMLLDLRDRLQLSDEEASGAFIFQSHVSLLDDPMFTERARREIVTNLRGAESAVSTFAKEITAAFRALDDKFFQEKAADVQDVMRHLLYSLEQTRSTDA